MAETMTLEEAIVETNEEIAQAVKCTSIYANVSLVALRTLLSAARRLDGGVEGWAMQRDGKLNVKYFFDGEPTDELREVYRNTGADIVPVLIVPAAEPAGE